MRIDLMQGDCLDVMQSIADISVDMVFVDPPYGTTACIWDSVIPLEPMWEQIIRVAKPKAAIVFTAAQPYTTALIASNYPMFKYCWVWDKVDKYTNHLNAKHQPMRRHEDIVVFSSGMTVFNRIKREASYISRQTKSPNNNIYGESQNSYSGELIDGLAPCSVLEIPAHKQTLGIHPSEKPVHLMEYLLSTYSNDGETVLDFTMGSGTTGVACKNLNRSFIGIEKDAKYFRIAKDRIHYHEVQQSLIA